MRNDLIHQSSEFDCGPTCMVNAMRYLFDRKEIQPGVLKQIWIMEIDTYCDQGHVGRHGTSRASMKYMTEWLAEYGRGCKFPIASEFVEDGAAVIEPGGKAWKCLESGGCIIMRCYTGGIAHYVLLTKILPSGEIGLFDPYAEDPKFEGEGRRVVEGHPKEMNRAVRWDLLNLEDRSCDYAMGEPEIRELILLSRRDEKKE